MRRKKRLSIVRIGLALAAVAAIMPVAAQAKPQAGPTYEITGTSEYQLGPAEIPYLSHGQGVDESQFSGGGMSPDDRSHARTAPTQPSVEIPYLSHGRGVTAADLGFATSNSPDDRPYQRPITETPVVVSDGGSGIDVNPFAVTGFGLALLLAAGGMGLLVRHNRRTRLSPA